MGIAPAPLHARQILIGEGPLSSDFAVIQEEVSGFQHFPLGMGEDGVSIHGTFNPSTILSRPSEL
jgi:hypothetical protein